MIVLTSYEKLKANIPELLDKMISQMNLKIEKSKSANDLDKNPENWTYEFSIAQRVRGYSFEEVLSGKVEKMVIETAEEKVNRLFKNGDLFVDLVVKNKKLKVEESFPKYIDDNFYIPVEIVNTYDSKKIEIEKMDSPTIFIYINDNEGERLEETYVLGIVENTVGDKSIVLKCRRGQVVEYSMDEKGKVLYTKNILGKKQINSI